MKTTINDIPRDDLVAMLKQSAWCSGNREGLPPNAYSLDVSEETAFRDVIYRKEQLYPTPEEAIVAHWERHYKA